MSSRKNRRSEKILVKEGIQDVNDANRKKFGIAGLPRLELLVYGAIAIVFFIWYPIYKVYVESQASVYKFNYGVLVDGFDVLGGLKDDADFEWNFWRELITLKGSVIVFTYIAFGRLALSFCAEWRNSVLLLFSMVSITLLVTWKCMLVLLCYAVFMYLVSFSKRALVVWAAVLGQLYTIMSPFLLSYLSNFTDSEFDYHMTIFSVALCNLRFLSFCLDYCSHFSDDSTRFGVLDFLLYIFYLPLFFSGPLMSYKDFHNQIEKKSERLSIAQYLQIIKELLRYVICIIFIEIAMHFVYFAAYHQSFNLLRRLPLWALAGNGLCHLIFFQLKYEVMFGVPRTVAMLDQVNTPKPPVCILAVFRFVDMWRYFDRGLHSILLNFYWPVGIGIIEAVAE
ncbi:protein-cysteine N-palmitoyltransferase HHAT-like isoform X2 [Anneissia japonica]|uniref:protein-cysteine N-palmitoyltransferase HHAT-like isoform X2 n=1 Tax=Anneissia japonica TaxID=1529436 RepID=UPI001425831B|nr:protein-cysteine N-palmitoyltransferase HHAT-like isoform X2 [Anneissia japonica]